MKRIVLIGVSVCLFALGMLVGRMCFRADPKGATPREKPVVAAKRIADAGDSAALAALRRRVTELERQLATAQGARDLAVSNAVAAAQRERGPGPRGGPRLEELKEKDPARYTQITNRMAQFRQHRQERARAQLDFLSSIDTSRMSASARKTHARYQSIVARRQALEDELQNENLTEEERRAQFKELHETGRQMRQLGRSEREVLVEETARSLGFEGDDVKVISETMSDIVEATEGGGHGQPPPPPGETGGGPGGPGGGPR